MDKAALDATAISVDGKDVYVGKNWATAAAGKLREGIATVQELLMSSGKEVEAAEIMEKRLSEFRADLKPGAKPLPSGTSDDGPGADKGQQRIYGAEKTPGIGAFQTGMSMAVVILLDSAAAAGWAAVSKKKCQPSPPVERAVTVGGTPDVLFAVKKDIEILSGKIDSGKEIEFSVKFGVVVSLENCSELRHPVADGVLMLEHFL